MEERYTTDSAFFAEMWECFEESDKPVCSDNGDDSISSVSGESSTGRKTETCTSLSTILQYVFCFGTSEFVAQRKAKTTKSGRAPVQKVRIDGKRRLINGRSVQSALMRAGPRINVSRRPPSAILYAFPTFDKCDSLLYFPTTMTRHLNSGDMAGLTKLFNTHFDKKASFNLSSCQHSVNTTQQLLKSYEYSNDLQPDRIMCVHSTKVVENTIETTIHMKFTDCAAIYESVLERVISRNDLPVMHVTGDRTADIKAHISEALHLPASTKQHYLSLADSGVDFVVYVQLNTAFTFDDMTKKITFMSCSGRLSSMHAVETATRDL